jgi:hypothetical protein
MENVLGDRTNLNDNSTDAVFRRVNAIYRTNENTRPSNLTLEQLHQQIGAQREAHAVLQRHYEIVVQENRDLRDLPMNGGLRSFIANQNYVEGLEEKIRDQVVEMEQLADMVEERIDRLTQMGHEKDWMAKKIRTLEARLQIKEKQEKVALNEVQYLLKVVDEQVRIQDTDAATRMQQNQKIVTMACQIQRLEEDNKTQEKADCNELQSFMNAVGEQDNTHEANMATIGKQNQKIPFMAYHIRRLEKYNKTELDHSKSLKAQLDSGIAMISDHYEDHAKSSQDSLANAISQLGLDVQLVDEQMEEDTESDWKTVDVIVDDNPDDVWEV